MFDPASTEVLIELGRSLYKLMFQLLLLIESDHKIAVNVIGSLQQNERMDDLSHVYADARGALLRCIDDAEMDSMDTSTSTEGDITPTPSPGLPMSSSEFEGLLFTLIDQQKWPAIMQHVRQHKVHANIATLAAWSGGSVSPVTAAASSGSEDGNIVSGGSCPIDDLSVILNIYSQRLIKDRNGEFICIQFCSTISIIPTFFQTSLYRRAPNTNWPRCTRFWWKMCTTYPALLPPWR